MSEPPVITVITPALNERATLPVLDRSLASQGIQPSLIDWVIVDDGSTDGTREWLTEGPWHVRPRPLFLPKSIGPGEARNLGLDAAAAPLLTFIDADDSLNRGALRAWVDSIRVTPADMLLTPSPEHLSKRRRARLGTSTRVLTDAERWSGDLLRDWLPAGKLYKTEFVRMTKLRFLAAPEAEDLCFFVMAALSADRIAVAPGAPTYNYFRPNRSAPSQAPARPEESLEAIIAALEAVRRAAPLDAGWIKVASPVLAGLAACYLRASWFAKDDLSRRRITQRVTGALGDLALTPWHLRSLDPADIAHAVTALLALSLPDKASWRLAGIWVSGLHVKTARRGVRDSGGQCRHE